MEDVKEHFVIFNKFSIFAFVSILVLMEDVKELGSDMGIRQKIAQFQSLF